MSMPPTRGRKAWPVSAKTMLASKMSLSMHFRNLRLLFSSPPALLAYFSAASFAASARPTDPIVHRKVFVHGALCYFQLVTIPLQRKGFRGGYR